MFTHKFSKPLKYNSKSYEKLDFDFDSLTGRDALDVSAELDAKGSAMVVPSLSMPFQVGIATKACTEKIGSDAFDFMPLHDFFKITSEVRNFLLGSGSGGKASDEDLGGIA
jgi:hypothetical protein